MKPYFSASPAWLLQRISALYALGFMLFIVAHEMMADRSYSAWKTWVQSPQMRISALLFFATLAFHAWVGLRDVVIDYVKPPALRLAVLGGIVAGIAATLAWASTVLS